MNTNTENKIEENLDYAIREVRDKINDGNCTINEALYYIGNWQKEKDKAVNDSLLNENKNLKVDYEFADEMKNEYQKKVQQLEAINDSLLKELESWKKENFDNVEMASETIKELQRKNGSLLNALKNIVYQYEEMAKMSCADNHIEFRIKDFTSLSNGKEAIKKATE